MRNMQQIQYDLGNTSYSNGVKDQPLSNGDLGVLAGSIAYPVVLGASIVAGGMINDQALSSDPAFTPLNQPQAAIMREHKVQ